MRHWPHNPFRGESRTVLAVVVALVVVVAGLLVAIATAHHASAGIVVTGVTYNVGGCGFGSGTGAGFAGSPGGSEILFLSLHYTAVFGLQNCAIMAVATETAGFSLTSNNTPFAIPSGSTEGLVLGVQLPPSSYSGPLVVDVSAVAE